MTDHLDDRTYNLLFSIRRSCRYHQHRRKHYETWNSVTIIIAAIGGSSAAAMTWATLPQQPGWAPTFFAAFVALVSTIDLAVGTSRLANQHAELARRFIFLEQRFAHNRSLDDSEFEEVTQTRLDIEASEPTVLRLLDVMCHFELLRAYGDQAVRPVIPLWRRKLANWFSQYNYAQDFLREYMKDKNAVADLKGAEA